MVVSALNLGLEFKAFGLFMSERRFLRCHLFIRQASI